MLRFIRAYQNFQPFSDREAWALFRLAAFGEAIGWSLLIFGIICRTYIIPGSNVFVAVGGRIHGMLFFAYIAAVLAFAPSMRWPLPQTLLGGLMSVPPYGSLLFEMIISRQRRTQSAHALLSTALYRQALEAA
jgi:integral membrane protein